MSEPYRFWNGLFVAILAIAVLIGVLIWKRAHVQHSREIVVPSASSFMKPFSEADLADVGRIVAAWSHVELQFDMLFLSLVVFWGRSTGSTKEAHVKSLMGDTFGARLSMLRKRVSEMDLPDETLREADAVLSQLDTLRNERDHVAHSIWSPHLSDPEVAMALYKSWRNEKEYDWKPVKQERLKEIFSRMEALFWRLFHLSFVLNPSPRRPRDGVLVLSCCVLAVAGVVTDPGFRALSGHSFALSGKATL